MTAATKRLRAAQTGVAGFALGLLLFASLSETAYWKDIQVEYLTAKALRRSGHDADQRDPEQEHPDSEHQVHGVRLVPDLRGDAAVGHGQLEGADDR